MSEQPKTTLREAAHTLWESFFKHCPGRHPYVESIAVGGDEIKVFLARKPMHHERPIPSEWEGWPVTSVVSGRMRLC
jgi:hypothetical protein